MPTVPTVSDLSYTVNHGGFLSVDAADGLLSGSGDADGDTLTSEALAFPDDSISFGGAGDGSFSYVSAPGFVGTDTFTYNLFDGAEYSGTQTVTIHVTDTAPTAIEQTFSVHQGQELDVDADDGLLNGAYDADGDSLSASIVSAPSNGYALYIGDGSFDYTPPSGFVGSDTFTYDLFDGAEYSAAQTVTIHVTDTAPVVSSVTLDNDSPQTNDTLTATASASDADGDPITYTYVWYVNGAAVQTTSGTSSTTDTLDLSQPGNGDKGDTVYVSVTPNDGAEDGTAVSSETATVANTTPVISSVTLDNDSPQTNDTLTATVSASDADSDPLTYTYVWYVNGSSVQTTSATSSATDTLDLSQPGNGDRGDTIYVSVTPNDGTADGDAMSSETATVVNAAPVASNPTLTTGQDDSLTISPSDLASEPDGDPITITSVGTPSDGDLIDNGDGTYTYDPYGVIGPDSFTYTVSDPYGATDSGTATINVQPYVEFASTSPYAQQGSNIVLVVMLSAAAPQDVTVNYATSDDTAKSGTDYTSTSGSLTIPAGATSATANVATLDDAGATDGEDFEVDLTDPSGAKLDGLDKAYPTIFTESAEDEGLSVARLNTLSSQDDAIFNSATNNIAAVQAAINSILSNARSQYTGPAVYDYNTQVVSSLRQQYNTFTSLANATTKNALEAAAGSANESFRIEGIQADLDALNAAITATNGAVQDEINRINGFTGSANVTFQLSQFRTQLAATTSGGTVTGLYGTYVGQTSTDPGINGLNAAWGNLDSDLTSIMAESAFALGTDFPAMSNDIVGASEDTDTSADYNNHQFTLAEEVTAICDAAGDGEAVPGGTDAYTVGDNAYGTVFGAGDKFAVKGVLQMLSEIDWYARAVYAGIENEYNGLVWLENLDIGVPDEWFENLDGWGEDIDTSATGIENVINI